MRLFMRPLALSVAVLICMPANGKADLSQERKLLSSAFVSPSSGAPDCKRYATLSMVRHVLNRRTRACAVGRHSPLSQLCMIAEAEAKQQVEAGRESGTKTMKATEYYKPLVEGDILESDDRQRAIVGVSYAALAVLFTKGCILLPPLTALVVAQTLLAVLVGFEFADLGSGVYHWSMDNYGSRDTPVFGTQIEAFQGHHELPWTITYRQVCNNIYKICQATAPFCVAGIALVNNPFVLIWMATSIAFINLSQELHKWSHQSPQQTPWWVNALQDRNLIISRKAHLAHHKPPFEGNYCIVSGHCNPIADSIGLFRGLEWIVYALTGNKARCETNERLLESKVVELGIKRASTTLK